MKNHKKLRTVLVTVLALVLLSGTVLAVAAASGWMSASGSGSQTTKYEKPSLNEVAQEGLAPDPMEPDASAIATDKPWYEYITYTADPIGEFTGSDGVLYKYYDPYDYNYGLVMDIKDTNVASGAGGSIPCTFTSANELSVTWSTTSVHYYDHTIDVGAEVMGGWESGLKLALAKLEVTLHATYAHNWGTEFEDSVELGQTFSAVHFNSKGAPYQWRVVNFVVSMPLKVEVYKPSEDGFILDTTTYVKAPTIQGVCRQYIINGVVYIEDWRTGDGVPLDDFWDQYLTPEKVKEAYSNKLLPKS